MNVFSGIEIINEAKTKIIIKNEVQAILSVQFKKNVRII